MAKEGFPISWTTNTIQMISKSRERNSLGNYRTIMLDAISDKFYGSILGRFLIPWVELKGFKARVLEGWPTLDYILKLHTLVEQGVFAGGCFYSCFIDVKNVLTKFHVTSLQQLGAPHHLQQVIKAMYMAFSGKVWINGDTHGEKMLEISLKQGCIPCPTLSCNYIDEIESYLDKINRILRVFWTWHFSLFFMMTMLLFSLNQEHAYKELWTTCMSLAHLLVLKSIY